MKKFCLFLFILFIFAFNAQVFGADVVEAPLHGQGHVTIKTNVTGIKVYVDRLIEIEETKAETFTIQNLKPGRHIIVLKKSGYYTEEFYVHVKADQEIIHEISLKQITGFLNVEIEQKNATLYIDGEKSNPGFYELPIGTHELTVKLFGYNTYKKTVSITQQDLVMLAVNLKEADFAITNFSVSKDEFNPFSQGSLGSVDLKISVTAPGNGTLFIKDNRGNVVYSYDFGEFKTWDTSTSWNGKDFATGMVVPDGFYKVVVEAEDKIVESSVYINSSLFYPLANVGSRGLQFGTLVDPEFAPGGTFYFAIDASPTFNFEQFESCPLSINLLIGASKYFSLGGAVAFDFTQKTDEIPVWWSANAKLGNKFGNLYYSLYCAYTGGKSDISRFNKPGFDFGLALGLSFGRIFVVANGGAVYNNDFESNAGLAFDYQAETCSFGIWASSNVQDEHLVGARFCQYFGTSQFYLNCDVSADILKKSISTKIGVATVF